MISTRERLGNIGEPRAGHNLPVLTRGFHSAPRSLWQLLKATFPPGIERWRHSRTSHFSNEPWTEECQGLVFDGQFWYVSSNREEFRAVHKFSLDFRDNIGHVQLPPGTANHVGALTYHDGVIYVPLTGPKQVWEIDQDLHTLRISRLPADPDPGLGWCAVNPWNRYLYTSPGDRVQQVHAYDPAQEFAYQKSLTLEGPPVRSVQGGCFSTHGHLYLNSDRYVNPDGTKEIFAYSAINGALMGVRRVSYDDSTFVREEMEGIAIATLGHSDGSTTHFHVLILDNDIVSTDDVRIQHFEAPDPSLM